MKITKSTNGLRTLIGFSSSYPRSDTQPWARRLAEDLRSRFGYDRFFPEVDSSHPAIDYRTVIDATLAESRIVAALLSPQWAACFNGDGQSRLMDPNELVRIELGRALVKGIPILPIFIGDAGMPIVEQFPVSLQSRRTVGGCG